MENGKVRAENIRGGVYKKKMEVLGKDCWRRGSGGEGRRGEVRRGESQGRAERRVKEEKGGGMGWSVAFLVLFISVAKFGSLSGVLCKFPPFDVAGRAKDAGYKK